MESSNYYRRIDSEYLRLSFQVKVSSSLHHFSRPVSRAIWQIFNAVYQINKVNQLDRTVNALEKETSSGPSEEVLKWIENGTNVSLQSILLI